MSFDSPPLDALGRIVVVAAGFALWKGGKCIAAARWSDIRRVRAHKVGDTDATRLLVELMDGTILEFHEKAPGFDAFLDRASVTLAGLLVFAAWHPALMLAPAGGDGTVIFERPAPRR
ncbi:MAG: hypothetical protein ABJE10_15840 [bacterium]